MSVAKNLTGHSGWVYAIEYMPDGTLVTGSDDKTMIVWEPRMPKKLVTFNPFNQPIYCIRLVSQDQVVAVSGQNLKIEFYRINGSLTPVFIKSIASCNSVFNMIVYNVIYNDVNSTILYAAVAELSNAISVNVTNVNNIELIQTVAIDEANNTLYAVEKSGFVLFFLDKLSNKLN